MKQLSIAMTDAEISDLFETGDSSRSQKAGHLDISNFVKTVQEASKSKPLPSFLTTAPTKPGSKVQSRIGMGSGNAAGNTGGFENWEVEKKYKKNLEALKHEIEERNSEILIAKKEVQDVNKRVVKLENEKQKLETKLVDQHALPPREMNIESMNQGQ